MNYRLLGRSGLRVSELCLGTMSFGTEWNWGADKAESLKIFDAYAEKGGNFVDTANRYTEGTSEKWLGEFIHSERHHFVLATKFTLRDGLGDPNFAGNHRKNMIRSVEESLVRLNTEFIDLLWVHAWDGTVGIDEVLRGLQDLIRSGKVQHIGISDTPAWIVSAGNTLAELRGWDAFIALQVEYSLLARTAERDLLPMAEHFGLAVTPWGAIGGGALTGKYLKGGSGRLPEHSIRRSDRANKIAAKVVKVAEKMKVPPVQIAINWTRQRNKALNIIPIVGATKGAQLATALECVEFEIPQKYLSELDEASKIELGFPHDFLRSDNVLELMFSGAQKNIIR